MSIEYPFSLAQLAQILSALEHERRNPNTRRNAIKAIGRNAAQIGLAAEDVFDAACLEAALIRHLATGLKPAGPPPIGPPAEPVPETSDAPITSRPKLKQQ